MNTDEKNQNVLIICGFILISAICVSPMILFGKTLVLRDTFFEFRFLYDFSKENIINGIIPLWNPYSNCGQPFIANPQSAFFYPLNWIYALLNFNQAYTLFIFIHLFMAGFFMHAFVRPIVKSNWISFFGGVIFMLNGLLISRIEFLSEFASIVWLPAILALLRVTLLAPSWLNSVLLGLAMAIQFFAGHTQTFYYTAFFGLIFLIFLVFVHFVREKKTAAVLPSMKFLIAAGLLALLIIMVQLAPTYELFSHSLRSQADYDAKTHLASVHPMHALTFLFPYLFGWPGYKSYWGSTYEFWASSFYVGVMPFVFCLLAALLFYRVKKTRSGHRPLEISYFLFFLVWFAIAFIIALGDYSPVFRIFHAVVPGFDKFRWPSSSLVFCMLSMSIMAPLGLKWLLQETSNRALKKNRWVTVTFGALIAVFVTIAVVMNLSPEMTEKIAEALRPTPSQSLAAFRDMVESITGTSILGDGDQLRNMGRTVLFSSFFIIIICGVLWGRFRGKIPQNYLLAGVIFLTAIDLIGHAGMGVVFLDQKVNLTEPGLSLKIGASSRNQRVMALTDDFQQYAYGTKDSDMLTLGLEALTGEVGLAQQLFRTEGKGVLKIKNYSEFMGFRGLPFHLQLKILKFLNVKNVVHFKSRTLRESDSAGPETQLVDRQQKMAALDSRRWSVELTTVGETMPRIFVVPRFEVMPSDSIDHKNRIFKRFLEGSFDFSETVIVDQPPEGFAMADGVKFTIHQPASYANPNQVRAVIETDRDGILVISDVFYPGWELFVNGEKQKIYKANTTFRAGVLKSGVNHILFNYNPQSFKIGYLLTILGIMSAILMLIIHFRMEKALQRESS